MPPSRAPLPLLADAETNLVFGLKEVKALLDFCEKVDGDAVELFFVDGGQPIVLAHETNSFTVELTMATMQANSRSV